MTQMNNAGIDGIALADFLRYRPLNDGQMLWHALIPDAAG
jgi:hypothetical protein